MRIAYCTTIRLPSERARAYQVAKVAEALREANHTVEIFSPFSKDSHGKSFESYYSLSSPVRLHHPGKVDVLHSFPVPGVSPRLAMYFYKRGLARSIQKRRKDFDFFYTRSIELLPVLIAEKVPVAVELDHIPKRGLQRFVRLLRGCRLIIALTSQMRQELIDIGVVSVPVIVEGDSVDLHDFEALPSSSDTRISLDVPKNVPLFVFVGQLEAVGLSRGIPELLSALRILRKRGLEFRAVIAGGPDHVRKKYMASLSEDLSTHVQFIGRIEHLKVPTLLSAADVLLYPAPNIKHPFYTRDHSPLMLVEYMAAERPIVSADLAPLHDIVDDTMVTFCAPGDAEAMADAIRSVLDEKESAFEKAKIARHHVEQFTWERRMERITKGVRL